ncbi:MAG: alpha/beta hydrolase [Chloroflexi bacterium]|nr:MAG: alpha/beta hydrolase [Chloroflexota bacterium]
MHETIRLWPNGAPGSEGWAHYEQKTHHHPPFNITIVRNVTDPTLSVHLPDPAVATGAGVIVCPGGAFHILAIDHEGYDVADWLTAHGVAAFVLKYRLIQTPPDDDAFAQQMQANMQNREQLRQRIAGVQPLAVADGQAAVKLVRQRAAEWGIDPERIGMMGFSAGAMLTIGLIAQNEAESRLNFAAPIYGPVWDKFTPPPDAPPVFLAVTDDDELAARSCANLYLAWKEAGRPVELHIYAQGGHGFGMRKQGLPVDHWIERFDEWLQAQGLKGARGR